jgi:hypothetical protein
MEQSLDELRRRLADAQEAHKALLVRGRLSRVPLAEYLAAHERELEAERRLAAAAGNQYASPMELGFVPEAGVSAPVLLQNDYSAIMTFSAVTIGSDGSRTKTGTAIIELDRCQWTTFGYPNDEAIAGHPLYGRGLCAYGIFEVHDSHWVRRMFEQNKVSFPNTKPWSVRHFLFSFHDSTFECICHGIKATSLSQEPYPEIFDRISSTFRSNDV